MRWTKQDKILKSTYKEIKKSFDSLQKNIEELNYKLGLDFEEINNLGNRQKRILDNSNLVDDELLMFYRKQAKTNRDILFVLLLNEYLIQSNEINKLSNEVFDLVSKDSLSLLPFKASVVNSAKFATILGSPYKQYLKVLSTTDAMEAQKLILTSLQNKVDLFLDKLIEKQRKRILNINDDKFSGVLHDISIKVANDSYVEPLKDKNRKVKFCAIEDDRTTPMCKSMDGMVFNTVDKNIFDRETQTGIKHYEIDGLVDGINLPPISDYTHHCRSWVELID